jgi:ankyrin repeat protein
MSSLHQATITGSMEIIKLLIECGSKLDIKDNKGMRPLHYSAYNGKTDIAQLLLRCGSNCNEQTFNGDTPMHYAALHGHADIVFQLLNFGADVRLTNTNFQSALDVACENGRVKVVEILLQSGLCANLIRDKSRDLIDAQLSTTCLHLAAKNNHTDIIRLLLLYGVDINRFTHHGTALHEACRYGRYQAAKVLLEVLIGFVCHPSLWVKLNFLAVWNRYKPLKLPRPNGQ